MDVEVVPVPVSAVAVQPSLGYGPYEAAAGGEVKVLGSGMLLGRVSQGLVVRARS